MKNLTPKHQKAFSIIEVMVAIVVTVVGILAIAKFQGTVLQSGSDANQRVMAVTLAERKLEEFKNQAAVPGTGYSSIVSGSDPLESVGDSQFEVKWTVDNYVYPTTKLQVAKLEPSATHPDYKQINFTISWLGLIGQQRLELSAVINSLSALSTGFGPGVGVSGEPPTVFYNPLSAPDVVPVTIESPDLKKETSKPLPDVTQKGGSTAVSFEVVTYAPYGGGLFETLRREEFLTVSCGCTTTGATGTRIEGGVVWDEDADILRDVRNVTAGQKFGTKLNSGDFSGQPFECDVCCRNKEPNPLVASGDYMQVCRLKRIDGIMTVVPDWKLVAFDLIPDNFFDKAATGYDIGGNPVSMTTTLADQNIDAYSDYVIDEVRDRLISAVTLDADPAAEPRVMDISSMIFYNTDTAVENTFHTSVSEFVNGSLDHKVAKQGTVPTLSARAVYMDLPPVEIFGLTYTATNVPLKRVPFYTVNVTKLAGWIPDGDSNNTHSVTDADPGDTDFTRGATLTDYAEALVNLAPPGDSVPATHPSNGIHDPVKVTGGVVDSECRSTTLRNCVKDELINDKTEGDYTRGNFYANIITILPPAEPVTTRIKKSNSGITDTAQNGVQNVADMPAAFSAQNADSSVDMSVK